MRKKTSVIWKISKEKLLSVVSTSTSFGEILKYFNLTSNGGNVKTLKSRLICDNIGYEHIRLGKNSNLGRKFLNSKKINLDKILTEQSSYSRGNLKRRLISENILQNKCIICGLENRWQEKPLTLQLDHINGISNDNRLENLRLLCPNCHSQTETFAGRSLRKKDQKKYYCSCGEEICKYSTNCNICVGSHKRKFNPTRQELEDLVQLHPMTTIGKMFGVSDNAVRKRCIKLGIEI